MSPCKWLKFIVTDLLWKLPMQKPTGRTCLLIERCWYVCTFVFDHFYTLVTWIIDSCCISCSDLLCCCVQALLEEWIATRAFRDNCLPQVSMPLKALVHIQLANCYFFEFFVQPVCWKQIVLDIKYSCFPWEEILHGERWYLPDS